MGEFDLSLIREFRSRPGFYDRNSPLFKDKVYNAREWQLIANKLGYDVSLLKDRMLQLRNRYNLEKRRLEQLHEENPGKQLESPWPLFDELTFLSEHIRARRSYKRLVPTISSSPQKYFPDMPNQVQSKMLPDQENSQDQLDMLEHKQQQLYNQQFYNNNAASMSPNASANLSAEATADASNAAARFAANGLLTVKMEEDADDEDGQQQEFSEDNLDNFNGDGADTDLDMTPSEAAHQPSHSLYQKQQQQQQQHSQKRTFTGSNNSMVISSISSKLHSTSSPYQHHGHSHKGKRFYLPSINKHKQQQQQLQPHSSHYNHNSNQQHQYQQQQHNHHQQLQQHMQRQQHAAAVQRAYSAATADYMAMSVDAVSMDKPRILSAREQKFVAFGRFMTSALLDLPQQTALLLLEKFTSEVVKGLLQKHNSKSKTNSSSSSSNNNHNHNHNDNNGHNSNNHNKMSVAAEKTNDMLDNGVLNAGMNIMSGLGLTDMVNVPNINLSLLTNGDSVSIDEN